MTYYKLSEVYKASLPQPPLLRPPPLRPPPLQPPPLQPPPQPLLRRLLRDPPNKYRLHYQRKI